MFRAFKSTILLLITVAVFFPVKMAFAYNSVIDPDLQKQIYSEDFKKKIESRFGKDCTAFLYCGDMFQLQCGMFGGGKRSTRYLKSDFSAADPRAWGLCTKIQKYRGEPASLVTAAAVKVKYGSACKVIETCDDMLYADCNAAADGPAYYLDKDLKAIGYSGGFCMGGRCSGAPKEWLACEARVDKELREKWSRQ